MNNNHLLPLLVSYSIAAIIERLNFYAETHYLLFSLHYLLIAYLCSKSTDKLILCYGILNVLALFLCVPLIYFNCELSFFLFHDASYGVGNWIIAVELLMIGFGGYNAIIYFVDNWRDNGYSWYDYIVRYTKEAFLQ